VALTLDGDVAARRRPPAVDGPGHVRAAQRAARAARRARRLARGGRHAAAQPARRRRACRRAADLNTMPGRAPGRAPRPDAARAAQASCRPRSRSRCGGAPPLLAPPSRSPLPSAAGSIKCARAIGGRRQPSWRQGRQRVGQLQALHAQQRRAGAPPRHRPPGSGRRWQQPMRACAPTRGAARRSWCRRPSQRGTASSLTRATGRSCGAPASGTDRWARPGRARGATSSGAC